MDRPSKRSTRRVSTVNDEPRGKEYYKCSIEYIIENPIRCGFLMAFCESQYNVENLSFLIAVIKFRDALLIDKKSWDKDWRTLDGEVLNQVFAIEQDENGQFQHTWPSIKVHRESAVEMMRTIVNDFIRTDAPHEICFSKIIQSNTLRRVALVDFYGPEVFTEATLDPLKTMKKDILPRYLASEHYQKMQERLAACTTLPSASELIVPPPDTRIIDDATPDSFPPDRTFDLIEILNCEILYSEFLLFLRQSVCTENLLCYRMIALFEKAYSPEDSEVEVNMYAVEDIAWNIFRFFIASGSAFEISLNYPQRRNVMFNLAKMPINLFEEVKRSVLAMLRSNYEGFKSTSKYESLSSELAARIRNESMQKNALSRFNCFA